MTQILAVRNWKIFVHKKNLNKSGAIIKNNIQIENKIKNQFWNNLQTTKKYNYNYRIKNYKKYSPSKTKNLFRIFKWTLNFNLHNNPKYYHNTTA